MKHITSKDGTVIACWQSGSGKPLLLVHGTTADHGRWSAITPHFAQNFSVYAMDRRGRGASSDAPKYNILREAEDVAAVAEAIGDHVAVLAHSYGAVCSLEGALLTDKIERLVLYEPPIPTGLAAYPPGVPERIQALVDDGNLEAALELFFREIVRMPEAELAKYRQLPAWQTRIQLAPTIPREMAFDQTYTFDQRKFAELPTPTLLLLGGESPPLFQQATAVADAALPNSKVVILPGQQHIAMDMAPELFVGAVSSFL